MRLLLFLITIVGVDALADPLAHVINARHKAKHLCGGVFVSGRQASDVLLYDIPELSYRYVIDTSKRRVTTYWQGEKHTAQYFGRYGCRLLKGTNASDLMSRSETHEASPSPNEQFVFGSHPGLNQVLHSEFVEQDPQNPRREREP